MLISAAAMEADRTVAIYSLPRLLGMLRDSYADGARHSLGDLIDQLSAVDLLHIDDVGAEQSSPWVLEQLYSIVNTRYEDRRAIVVTTNLITGRESDGPLREQIGDRTVSRLWEMCGDPYLPRQRAGQAAAAGPRCAAGGGRRARRVRTRTATSPPTASRAARGPGSPRRLTPRCPAS